jgi:hypothetical protein
VVSAVAYFFLKGVAEAQHYLFTTLPGDLGFDSAPMWWPIPLLAVCGMVVGLTIRYLPGTGGHEPAGRSTSDRASGHHRCGVRHAQLRGSAGT